MQTNIGAEKSAAQAVPIGKMLLSKVPEITIFFWIIKVLCTTIGETAADYLNETLGFGLTNTSLVMAVLLAVVLIVQFRKDRYVPWVYWLSVVLISVVGTLITDNLTDNLGVSLVTTTVIFGIVLAIVFAVWFKSEKTVSIHSIDTFKREAFYWLAILFTFALGTAAGDLVAEKFALGYLTALFIFAGVIALIAAAHYILKFIYTEEHRMFTPNAVLAFWLAYIMTRPLGASIGDYLSQARADGGLGLGTTVTSYIFLSAIAATVIYLSTTKKDVITKEY